MTTGFKYLSIKKLEFAVFIIIPGVFIFKNYREGRFWCCGWKQIKASFLISVMLLLTKFPPPHIYIWGKYYSRAVGVLFKNKPARIHFPHSTRWSIQIISRTLPPLVKSTTGSAVKISSPSGSAYKSSSTTAASTYPRDAADHLRPWSLSYLSRCGDIKNMKISCLTKS